MFCGEFEIVRSGPKVIFSVNGTGKYGMQDMLFVVLNISKKFVRYVDVFLDCIECMRCRLLLTMVAVPVCQSVSLSVCLSVTRLNSASLCSHSVGF